MTYDSATTWASTLWVCGSHFRLPPWQPPMACGGVPTLLYGVEEEKKICGLCGHASLALSFACSSFLTTFPLYVQHLTTLVFCFQNATPFPMLNILCYSVPYLLSLYPSSEVTISNMLLWPQPPSLEESSTNCLNQLSLPCLECHFMNLEWKIYLPGRQGFCSHCDTSGCLRLSVVKDQIYEFPNLWGSTCS